MKKSSRGTQEKGDVDALKIKQKDQKNFKSKFLN